MITRPDKLPISVIVPIKNEERNIAACLESVVWADEIWVVDSHSSDGALAVARRYTDKIAQFDYSGGFPKKKNWALQNLPLKHEWVLLLDADERVTPELENEIRGVLNSGGSTAKAARADGYYVNRKLIFLGQWIKHCGWYPSWNLRLFKHRLGRFEKLEAEDVENAGDVEVHEHVVLEGEADYLKNDLLHEDFKSIYHFIERHNRTRIGRRAFITTWRAAWRRPTAFARRCSVPLSNANGSSSRCGRGCHSDRSFVSSGCIS